MSSLRRAKGELERRLRDQDEELDDLAGQIQVRDEQLVWGGGDEVSSLYRAEGELERRLRDQNGELDDLAGQIQMKDK